MIVVSDPYTGIHSATSYLVLQRWFQGCMMPPIITLGLSAEGAVVAGAVEEGAGAVVEEGAGALPGIALLARYSLGIPGLFTCVTGYISVRKDK